MLKDLGLAQDAAAESNICTPLGSQSMQIYRLMTQKGYGMKDFSSVYRFVSENTKPVDTWINVLYIEICIGVSTI